MPVSGSFPIGDMISGYLQYRAQQEANQIAWMNLFEQKRLNREREKMEKADKGDVYGNVLRYVPGQGWKYDLEPRTKGILDAQRREEMRSLMEDAPRNRAQRVRKDERSKKASSEYERLFNEYKYRDKPSEGKYLADAYQEAIESRKRGASEAAGMVARQLMRTGGTPQAIAQVYNEAQNALGDSLISTMAGARRRAKEEHAQDRARSDSDIERELQMMYSIANDTEPGQVMMTDEARQLTGRQDNAFEQLMKAMELSQANSAQAYQFLTSQLGNAPKFGGSASFSSSGGGQTKKDEGFNFWKLSDDPSYRGDQGSFF